MSISIWLYNYKHYGWVYPKIMLACILEFYQKFPYEIQNLSMKVCMCSYVHIHEFKIRDLKIYIAYLSLIVSGYWWGRTSKYFLFNLCLSTYYLRLADIYFQINVDINQERNDVSPRYAATKKEAFDYFGKTKILLTPLNVNFFFSLRSFTM